MAAPKSDPAEKWRDAALSGDFARLKETVNDVIAGNWPEYKGHVFIHEFSDKPADEDQNRENYVRFVQDLYRRKYAKGQEPDLVARNVEYLAEDSDDFFDSQINAKAPHKTGNNIDGQQLRQSAAYYTYRTEADGKITAQPNRFPVSILSLNSTSCAHCSSQMAKQKAEGLSCAAVSPDEVFQERLEYFATAMHETGHGMRALQGKLRYETEDDKRYEENIARVFENLMVAKTFGVAGVLKLHKDAAATDFGSGREKNIYYEAIGPMKAAVEYVQQQGGSLAKVSPRELLEVAEGLVADHDLMRDLSDGELSDYKEYLKLANRSVQNIEERLQKFPGPVGPTDTFTAIIKNKDASGKDVTYSLPVPYSPIAREVDMQVLHRSLIYDDLTNAMMRLNPLRPQAMRGDPYPYPSLDKMADPAWQKAVAEFSKPFVPADCDVKAQLKAELDAAPANSVPAARPAADGPKNQ